jgi:hypothetical protein
MIAINASIPIELKLIIDEVNFEMIALDFLGSSKTLKLNYLCY